MSEPKHTIPYGESWTCTYGECCTDERCELWTWRGSIVIVVVFVVLAIAAVVRALV